MNTKRLKDIIDAVHEDIDNCKIKDGEQVTQKQLDNLEKHIKKKMKRLMPKINFRFSPYHFLQRANSDRNEQPINICHVREIFLAALNKPEFIAEFKKLGEKQQGAVLRSVSTRINIGFVIEMDKKGEKLEFVPVTAYAKKDFKSIEGRTMKVK